ncbi:hypothetical protein DL89DRAFT_65874 [Linderina pennispora]|uniref:Uncharacterized protein n=1 Tax=Linderina pennispora TaxID=61395 RepID=A0A1Y1W049_9FUNG|nr:uncharacterized protein DL89DRAFT_287003 [Linderina pennispora]XP_040740643.1 uncharacterized protein DL89DRAFT_65874 [Linderina pennispora]ORX65538.1 hypothetical protein DL89DRAFT_287003 [Linderina pennispora]ORX66655.1 hypothetical protein DL89DRAFT_65874 [Linderina pennispora]
MKCPATLLSLVYFSPVALSLSQRQIATDPSGNSAVIPGSLQGDGAGQPPFDTSAQQPISDPGDAAGLFPFDGNGQSLLSAGDFQQPSGSRQPPFGSPGQQQPNDTSQQPGSRPNTNLQQPTGTTQPQSQPTAVQDSASSSQTIPASILERMSSLFNFGQEVSPNPAPSGVHPGQSVSSPSRSAELRTDSLSTQQEESAETPGDLHANTGNVGRSVAACAVAVAAACILSGSI